MENRESSEFQFLAQPFSNNDRPPDISPDKAMETNVESMKVSFRDKVLVGRHPLLVRDEVDLTTKDI
ncbi:unnamed protein product [Lupinus luteus]|uniref:Uncharacterized protein n=1 Tax=Lupinus luteus TaxID=3873 RepID=A0AAV1VXP0_LUPLU